MLSLKSLLYADAEGEIFLNIQINTPKNGCVATVRFQDQACTRRTKCIGNSALLGLAILILAIVYSWATFGVILGKLMSDYLKNTIPPERLAFAGTFVFMLGLNLIGAILVIGGILGLLISIGGLGRFFSPDSVFVVLSPRALSALSIDSNLARRLIGKTWSPNLASTSVS